MRYGRLAAQYVVWHYGTAFGDLWRVFVNMLWFVWNLFSISFLLDTLFQPFQRIHEVSQRGDELSEFFSNIAANVLMRIVGTLVRLAVIIIGTVALFVTIVCGITALVVWPFLPIALVSMFLFGVPQLFL